MTTQHTKQSEREELMTLIERYAAYRVNADRWGNKHGDVDGSENCRQQIRTALLSADAKPVVDGELPPLPEWPEGFPDEWLVAVSSMMRDYARAALLAATPARQWVGLTKKEMQKALQTTAESIDAPCIVMTHWPLVARSIESKLKEKNGY